MKRCSSRKKVKRNSVYIPVDVWILIFVRLPVSSLLRFRCVSKLWSSIITSRDFRNQYANSRIRSSEILVSVVDDEADNLTLVSSPSRDVSLPFKFKGAKLCGSTRGLICFSKGAFQTVGICNPTTRQLHILPKVEFNRCHLTPFYFFGHDPVEDQYKVLAIDTVYRTLEHQILVLGRKEEEAWSEISCTVCPHTVATFGISINGFVYYGATRTRDNDNLSLLVSFDVRLEKFNIINVPPDLRFTTSPSPTLINYKGKVGVVEHPQSTASFRLWVLEHAEKQEWSTLSLSLSKSALPLGLDLNVSGIVSTNELCLVPSELSFPLCLYFYNLETNCIRDVSIQGLPTCKPNRFSISVSDHSETLSFLET